MKVSMSAVWDRTTEFLRDYLRAAAGIAAVAIFLPGVVTDVLAPLKQTGPAAFWGLGALGLVLGIVSLWGQLAIAALALEPAAGTAGARSLASRRLPATIGVLLIVFVAAMLLGLPMIGALLAGGVDLTRVGQPGWQEILTPGAGAFLGLYGLLVGVIVIWLAARFLTLVTPVILAERLALGALGRAWRLSRGLTWRIVGVLLLYGIVMGVATLAAVSIFGSIFALVFQPTGGITIASVLTALVSALVSAAFSVIATVFAAKLYLAARDREGAASA